MYLETMYRPRCSASHYEWMKKPAHRDSRGLPTRIMKCKPAHRSVGDCHLALCINPAYRYFGDCHFALWPNEKPVHRGTRELPSRITKHELKFGRTINFSGFHLRHRRTHFLPSTTTAQISTFGRMVKFSFFTFGTYVCFLSPSVLM